MFPKCCKGLLGTVAIRGICVRDAVYVGSGWGCQERSHTPKGVWGPNCHITLPKRHQTETMRLRLEPEDTDDRRLRL